jgi:hypothetical protein
LGTVPVNGSGQATLTTSALAVGSHPITAAYSGDTNFTTSGAALTQTVGQGSTSTALSSSQNPSTFGQSVTFTATVTGGAGTPTGTVTFRDGATVLGTVALNGSGQATFTTSSLAIGTHPITATYSGDANFTGSTSATLNQAVNQAGTATTLSSSQNPSTFGQPVTFTATVTASGAPTGTVTFTDGGTVLGNVAINGSGVATLTTSSLSPGSHSIVATYSGDATFQTSTSPVLNQVVNQAATTTALASSKNPSEFGQPVTFTATVTSSGGTPAGTVTFKDGATVLGTATLNGAGQASFTTSSLSVGSHPVTASYNGSASFAASTSAVVVQAVNVPADSVKLRALQIAVTKIEANNSGQAISGVIDSAIAEGFSGGGELITPSGTGVRFNFSAEPREMDPATGSVADRAGDAFAALGYAPRKQAVFKAPPPRSLVQPPREWLAWADVRGTGWSTDTSKSDIRGGQVNALLGITRNVTPDFILGAFGGYENFSYTSELLSGRLKGDGWTAGGYLGWRLIPGMRFDAAIARSGLTYNAVAGTASASIPGSRWLGSVGLTGTSKMQDWEIEPSARVYALWEREAAFTDSLGTQQTERNFSTGRASAGAKATYFTAWSDSVRLTPYLGLYGDYYFSKDDAVIALLDPPAYTLSGWSARLVSGVGVDLADGKKLSIDGEIGGLGGDHRMWTLRGRVAVPF